MSALEDYYAMLDAETEKLLSLNNLGNSQQQWEQHVSGVGADVQGEDHVSGNQFLQAKGRIFSGGTGDTPQRDKLGNITGYVPKVKAGSLTPGLDRFHQMQSDRMAGAPLATASGTPGLDALHKANPDITYSWQKKNPMVPKAFTAPDTAEMTRKIFV